MTRPGPRPVECPTLKTSVRILGQAQIDTFRAMCAIAGRRPHELAYDLVLNAIRDAQHDHETQALVAAVRRYQAREGIGRPGPMRLVYGGPGSRMGRREMLGAQDPESAP